MRQPHAGGVRRTAPLLPAILALGLLLTGCSGLPTAREMGDMALLRTLGVDPSPAGVAVTGSTGPRARGLQGEGEPALVLTADRASLSAACLAMQGQSDSFVFFGYVDQLLVGQALAEEGVRPVLDYFSRDAELGLGAQLWLIRGGAAREALSAGGDEGLDARLETLQNDSEMGIANLTRTAGEVYTDLLELGCAYVPALSPTGDGDALLREAGYGVLKGDALAGFLAGEAAEGLELLAGGRILPMLGAMAMSFLVPYLLLFVAGAITTATQWKKIRTSSWKKVLYTLTFPIFMATYVPITVCALFGKVEWKPIKHRAVVSIQELK